MCGSKSFGDGCLHFKKHFNKKKMNFYFSRMYGFKSSRDNGVDFKTL